MSRELDAQVAEKVIGIAGVYRATYPEWVQGERDWAAKGEWCYTDQNGIHYRVPIYSADIAAAWQVVDKMVAEGWSVSVWTWNGAWSAQFDKEIDYCAEGATAPEAICRAALKAKEAEHESH